MEQSLPWEKIRGICLALSLRDTIRAGKFRFEYIDSIPEVKKITLSAYPAKGFPPTWLELWVKPGSKTTIKGKDKLLRTWDVKSNVPEQNERNRYIEKNKSLLNQDQIHVRDIYEALDSSAVAKDEIEWKKYKIIMDSLYKICDSLRIEIMRGELELLDAPTYSKVWFDLFSIHAQSLSFMENYPDKNRLIKMYNNLPEKDKNTDIGQQIASFLFPPTIVKDGDKMADADLIDIGGNKKNLADYSGKYRLLDFWSTGCGPCIAAIPEMQEIAEKYKDNLVIVGINSDTEDIWKEFSNKTELAGVNLNDPKGETGLKLNYGITGIPHYVLLAPDDTIITSWSGYGKGSLLAKMKQLMK